MIKYLISAMVGILLVLSFMLNNCNSDKDDLKDLANDWKVQYDKLSEVVKKANAEIEAQRIDYEKKLNEYKNRKPRTVYIPLDVNMTRGDCNDVKNLIDGIRNIDF